MPTPQASRGIVQQRAIQCNRIQKLLETCNIKLAGVATDILGASGQGMLRAFAAGETDTARIADRARGRLRKKFPQLAAALDGVLSETQRWLLGERLDEIARLVGRLDVKLEELYRRVRRKD